jgi:Mrp family chromosome partitioning ATPase
MERLQKALEKARTERVRSSAVGEEAPDAAPGGPVDRWAEIPPARLDQAALRRNRVVSYDYGRDTAVFDILRTKIFLQMRKHGWRRIAVTSPTAACGKSTIVCNLALGLSRQSDVRTIAMELDLRQPSMAQMLGQTPAHDVTEFLSGKVGFAEQALRVRDNVALSLALKGSADPTRYLLSQSTEVRLAALEELYAPDIMLFDMPPVLVSDDTRAFLSKVDCALIVARAEKTTISQIDACEREVAEHTNVLGVTLNQARFADRDSEYGYTYGE